MINNEEKDINEIFKEIDKWGAGSIKIYGLNEDGSIYRLGIFAIEETAEYLNLLYKYLEENDWPDEINWSIKEDL